MMNSKTITIVKFAVSGFLLYFLYKNGNLNFEVVFGSIHTPAHYFLISLNICLFFLFQAYRWHYLLRAQDIQISFYNSFKYYLIGQFFASILPGAIGGDISRAYYIQKKTPSKRIASISTVFLDRIFGLYGLLLFAAIAFILHFTISGETVSGIFWSMGIISILVTLFLPVVYCISTQSQFQLHKGLPFIKKVNAFLERYRIKLYSLKELYFCGFLSVLSSLFFIWAFYIIANQMDNDLSILQIALPIPYIMLSNMLPITPGGIGVGELTSLYLFHSTSFSSGAETMLALRIWLMIFRLPGGVLFIFERAKY